MALESKTVKAALTAIDSAIAELEFNAGVLADAYWDEWKTRNEKLLQLRLTANPAVGLENTGRLAPRAYRMNKGGRMCIEWFDWSNNYVRKNVGKGIGKRIKCPLKGYTWVTVSKVGRDWEREIFERFENKFQPLRLSIDEFHETRKRLSRLLIKLNKREE
jgi:hypothetical protein